MALIRVILADLGEAVRPLVRDALADQPDVALVAETVDDVELLVRVQEADVVVLGVRPGDGEATVERLLDENPSLAVLTVDADLDRWALHQMRPSLEEVGALTTAALLAAVRQAAPPAEPTEIEDDATRRRNDAGV